MRRNTQNVLSIDAASILLDIRRHWWNILLVAFATAMFAASLIMIFSQASYSSSTILAVSSNSSDVISNARSATTVVSTLTNILNADVLKRLVAKDIGDCTYQVGASYITSTNLIVLKVTADSPSVAFGALQSILENYNILLEDLMSDVRLITLQHPAVPAVSNKVYNIYAYVAVSFAAGGILYAGLIVLLSLLRDTVKNSKEARNKIDTKILGIIPYLKEETIRKENNKEVPLMNEKQKSFWFGESFRRAAVRILNHMDHHKQKVLMITSVLPNEGKTTCCVNLALAIAQNNRRVLLIDGDFRNPSIASALRIGSDYQGKLSEALKTGEFDKMLLYQVPDSQLYCVTSREGHMQSNLSFSNGNFEKLIHYGRENFDFVIVDSGPVALVADIELMKGFCDAAVLVAAQDAAPARTINDAIDMLDDGDKMIGCVFKETRRSVKRKRREYGSYHQAMKEDR